ncbi:hypothetical protein ACHAXS_004781 [Conticribra weissflogii]
MGNSVATENSTRLFSTSNEESHQHHHHDDDEDDDAEPSSPHQPQEDSCIYLDYNGTTPIRPPVVEAMLPYLTQHFGNPSSSHFYGREPKRAVDAARRSVLKLIRPPPRNDDPDDDPSSSVIFTGCGTEANNLAIRLALLSHLHDPPSSHKILHVVTTDVEHPAISQCLRFHSQETNAPKIQVTYVPVNHQGIVSARDVLAAIRNDPDVKTALVTIMTANNEVGSIQPVFEIAAKCREMGVLFHTDAAQAAGKIDLRGLADEEEGGADMITVVGHKFGAPKGVAALYLRPGCLDEEGRRDPAKTGWGGSVLLVGGGQEFGRRGGTENVPYIVGMGRAAELLLEEVPVEGDDGEVGEEGGGTDGENETLTVEAWRRHAVHMENMRNRLLTKLQEGFREYQIRQNGNDVDAGEEKVMVRPNGPTDPKLRLPNTLSVGLRGVQSGALLAKIGNVVACSAGSACHSATSASCPKDDVAPTYSHVLKCMNVEPEYAIGTLRLSVGPFTTEEDVDIAADIIVEEALRQLEG